MGKTNLGRGMRVLAVALMAIQGSAHVALAGEADDLQNMIERSRRGVDDLKRLDEQHAASDEIALLSAWLDDAWRLRSEQKYDEVRRVLERSDAQADMIREKTTAAKLATQASEKEAAVKKLRAKVDAAKKDLQKTQLEKARLEGKTDGKTEGKTEGKTDGKTDGKTGT